MIAAVALAASLSLGVLSSVRLLTLPRRPADASRPSQRKDNA